MTRDEALDKIRATYQPGKTVAEMHLDAFVALGMLKLDDDVDDEKFFKVKKFMREFQLEDINPTHLLRVLDDCGLKIVEK